MKAHSLLLRAGLGLICAGLMAGCALGPVESDPVQADARSAQMKRDCQARGGVWNEEVKSCLAADPIRR